LLGRALALLCLAACGGTNGEERCGPSSGAVQEVVDGDTIVLDSGDRIRYLLVDTPEITNGHDDCYGQEAWTYNQALVAGQTVTLVYDVECRDRFERLLAYVSVNGREVNALLVERGFACVLYIPPDGADRRGEFELLEAAAKAEGRGLWGACDPVTCD